MMPWCGGTNYRKLPEILVECNDDLRRLKGAVEDVLVAGIPGPVRNGLNIVACTFEDNGCSSPDARVEEYLHGLGVVRK